MGMGRAGRNVIPGSRRSSLLSEETRLTVGEVFAGWQSLLTILMGAAAIAAVVVVLVCWSAMDVVWDRIAYQSERFVNWITRRKP